MKLYEDFIDNIEGIGNTTELINRVTGEFEDYPHIQSGLKSYIESRSEDDLDDLKEELIDLLNEINNLSSNEMDALDMAADEQGPWYFDDTVDIINRGDYIYFPEVESDEDLARAYINMIGSIEDTVDKSRLIFYIDIDEVADMFERDAELSGDEESEDLDHDAWYDIAEEEVENNPENYVDDFFDYEAFGRDLRIEGGWYFGDLGAISTQ